MRKFRKWMIETWGLALWETYKDKIRCTLKSVEHRTQPENYMFSMFVFSDDVNTDWWPVHKAWVKHLEGVK